MTTHNDIVEKLKPKVTVRPEQLKQLGNAAHILQSALDEWYKDFEPELRTALTEAYEAGMRDREGEMVEVIDEYQADIKALNNEMMGSAHDDSKMFLAYDTHSRLIAIKHIKEKLSHLKTNSK